MVTRTVVTRTVVAGPTVARGVSEPVARVVAGVRRTVRTVSEQAPEQVVEREAVPTSGVVGVVRDRWPVTRPGRVSRAVRTRLGGRGCVLAPRLVMRRAGPGVMDIDSGGGCGPFVGRR